MSQTAQPRHSQPSVNRRRRPKARDRFYQVLIGLNILAWLLLVVALIVFHYARPDFVTGLQRYWNIPGDTGWSAELIGVLFRITQMCLGVTIIAMIMRIRRTRRKRDEYGVNLYILLTAGLAILFGLTCHFS